MSRHADLGLRNPPGQLDLVVAGSVTRDVDRRDPRGWRVGGGATYGALVAARLGVRVGAVLGLDALTRASPELDMLRAAGVDIVEVLLDSVPAFENIETPGGRVQWCRDAGQPLPAHAAPDAWRSARAWLLSPVANELPDDWAHVPGDGARLALGWQGLLRSLVRDERVVPRAPRASALLRRAELVGLSVGDVTPSTRLSELAPLMATGARLVLTHGARGGLLGERKGDRLALVRSWPAVPARATLDPTGAGDSFLASLLVGGLLEDRRLDDRSDGPRTSSIRLAATVASLIVEGIGLAAVPTAGTIARRLREDQEAIGAG